VFSKYGIGTGPVTTSTGVAFNLLVDSRKNSINPEGGWYSSLVYRWNPPGLANDYRWASLYFDTRRYYSLSDRTHSILGIRAMYWGTFGDVPYFNLPGTSLDASGRSGRGYVLGRYRGKQMLYGETEYRFDISQNGLWGGVVFANLQSYTEMSSGQFVYVLPAAGTGLRIKFNKRSKVNLTLDFAAGKDSFNWYFNLGEFF
jgi:outer membrane protein assembly factor BamA